MSKKTRRRQSRREEDSDPINWIGGLILLGMTLIAVLAVGWGCSRHGLVWRSVLGASVCLAAGVSSVAIGLFELEWLERIVGFVDAFFVLCTSWILLPWFGSLSDSELVGRQRARVIWGVTGAIVFSVGCLLALRIF
jgi:hypothetical protein